MGTKSTPMFAGLLAFVTGLLFVPGRPRSLSNLRLFSANHHFSSRYKLPGHSICSWKTAGA
jgi:hypothetical protein